LTEATKNIQEAYVALKRIAGWTNHWRISNFLRELGRIRERIRARIQQGGFDLTALLEQLGYTSLEEFEHAIGELMESAQQQMAIRDGVRIMWTIREQLNAMELGIQNRWQGSH